MKTEGMHKTLIDIGLSESEATVYLASLSLGPSTVLKLARASELKRTTVYRVIEDLQKRGLMKIELTGLKQLYSAEDPKRLDAVLKSREKEFSEKLPEFEALYNLKQSGAEVRYYQGLESVKSALNMILKDTKSNDEYLVIADQESWFNQDSKFFEDFMERRANKNLRIRMLLKDSELTRTHKKFERNYNISIKILPKDTKLNTDLCITPQHFMIQQIKIPVVALVVDNQSIIETHREMFEILWSATKENAE